MPNILIIGAGISGLSAALALLQNGHRVAVLERGAVGGESSWAGGGILSPLLPWGYAEAVSALALRSMAGYADWVAGIEAVSGRIAEIAIHKCPLNQYAGLLRCARNDGHIGLISATLTC